MNTIAMPCSCCRRRSSSRICACTVTSSAVVGSSAISTLRLAGDRHRDHDALPHAARQLMRVLVEALRWRGNADLLEQLDRAPIERLRSARGSYSRSDSRSCRPMVCTGFSAVIGSWKIIADALAAHLAHLLWRELREVVAGEQDAAALDDAGGAGQEAHDGQRRHGLAAARFADEPERLAGRDGEAHAVDDALVAAFRSKPAA